MWAFDPRVDPRAFAALGYEAMSAGVARSQKDYREGWYAHARRNREFILNAAARVAAPRLAVILGAGKAFDLPLKELAARFERVVLIDIDQPSVEETAARHQAEPRAMDVTGIAAQAARGIESAITAAGDAVAADEALVALASSYRLAAPPRFLAEGERADLLVSGLVLTQLALPAKLLAKALFQRRFGDPSPWRWPAAWEDFDLRVQQDHIEALTAQAELAVLSSEVIHRVTSLLPDGGERLTGEFWSLVGSAGLEARVPPSLEILARSAWTWPRIRARRDAGGARMDVSALLLRRAGDGAQGRNRTGTTG